jgi:methionyl-tRNA synthetase
MIAKNCDGKVPVYGAFTPADTAILDQADGLLAKTRGEMRHFALHSILHEIWHVVAEANRYFASEEPWRLTKTDPARRDSVLYVTAEILRNVAILTQPFMPASAGKLLDLLGVAAGARDFSALGAGGRLVSGTNLPAPSGIFPRYIEEIATPAEK